MIPHGFIQDLLTRVDVVDVVGRHVQLKKAGLNYIGLCPFHGEKTPSFTVSPSKQFFHCFGCGAHGTAIGFLMDHRGLSFVEAIGELAQQSGMQVPESAPGQAEAAARTRSLTDLLRQASDFYRRQLKDSSVAIDYLKSRAVSGATAARYALGYAPDAWQSLRSVFDSYEDPRLAEAGLVVVGDEGRRYDRFRGRVMFPIRNRRGLVVGFGARVIGDGEPKYLNSPETPVFRKGEELYGLYEALESIRERKRAIVCEGYLDVIQLAQAGLFEAVAALGTAVTAGHVGALFRLTDHVVFAFDGDEAGRKAARRALEAALPVIGDAKRASFAFLPEGEDPDSLVRRGGADAFEAQIGRALPLSRWFVVAVGEGRDLDRAEDRAAMLNEARPLLESMSPGALRMQLLQELAHASRSSAEDIEALFGLRRWRRLPVRREPPSRQLAAVEGLKPRILQHLLAFPELAREFNAQIVGECVDSDEPTDRRIAEVWRAATTHAAATSGVLLELLADSEHAAAYQATVARDMLYPADAADARADLEGAFTRLELNRVEAQKDAIVRAIEAGGADRVVEYRGLLERHAQLKRQLAGSGSPS